MSLEIETPAATAPELFSIIHATPDHEDLPQPEAPYFVIDRKGFLSHRNTRLGRVLVRVDEAPSTITEYKFNGNFWPAIPAIPGALLGQVLGFFRDAFEKLRGEAAVLLLINDQDEWLAFVPPQEISSASVDYKYNPDTLPAGYQLVGTIHSHCDFSAFHSGTDETDAAEHNGIHITFGYVHDDAKFNTDVMLAFNGVMWKNRYKLSDVCNEVFHASPYPPEWFDQLSLKYQSPIIGNDNKGWNQGKPTKKPFPPTETDFNWLLGPGKKEPNNDYEKYGDMQMWPSTYDYALDQDIAMQEIAQDLCVLREIAESRNLDLTFTLSIADVSE